MWLFAAIEWSIMRRVIAIAVAGAGLAGCSSFSDYLKSTPPPVQVQLESVPSGAEATTSVGPGCKTPCSIAVAVPDAGFSVTFALPKFLPVTVPVQVIRLDACHHHDRSQSSGGRTQARRTPATRGA